MEPDTNPVSCTGESVNDADVTQSHDEDSHVNKQDGDTTKTPKDLIECGEGSCSTNSTNTAKECDKNVNMDKSNGNENAEVEGKDNSNSNTSDKKPNNDVEPDNGSLGGATENNGTGGAPAAENSATEPAESSVKLDNDTEKNDSSLMDSGLETDTKGESSETDTLTSPTTDDSGFPSPIEEDILLTMDKTQTETTDNNNAVSTDNVDKAQIYNKSAGALEAADNDKNTKSTDSNDNIKGVGDSAPTDVDTAQVGDLENVDKDTQKTERESQEEEIGQSTSTTESNDSALESPQSVSDTIVDVSLDKGLQSSEEVKSDVQMDVDVDPPKAADDADVDTPKASDDVDVKASDDVDVDPPKASDDVDPPKASDNVDPPKASGDVQSKGDKSEDVDKDSDVMDDSKPTSKSTDCDMNANPAVDSPESVGKAEKTDGEDSKGPSSDDIEDQKTQELESAKSAVEELSVTPASVTDASVKETGDQSNQKVTETSDAGAADEKDALKGDDVKAEVSETCSDNVTVSNTASAAINESQEVSKDDADKSKTADVSVSDALATGDISDDEDYSESESDAEDLTYNDSDIENELQIVMSPKRRSSKAAELSDLLQTLEAVSTSAKLQAIPQDGCVFQFDNLEDVGSSDTAEDAENGKVPTEKMEKADEEKKDKTETLSSAESQNAAKPESEESPQASKEDKSSGEDESDLSKEPKDMQKVDEIQDLESVASTKSLESSAKTGAEESLGPSETEETKALKKTEEVPDQPETAEISAKASEKAVENLESIESTKSEPNNKTVESSAKTDAEESLGPSETEEANALKKTEEVPDKTETAESSIKASEKAVESVTPNEEPATTAIEVSHTAEDAVKVSSEDSVSDGSHDNKSSTEGDVQPNQDQSSDKSEGTDVKVVEVGNVPLEVSKNESDSSENKSIKSDSEEVQLTGGASSNTDPSMTESSETGSSVSEPEQKINELKEGNGGDTDSLKDESKELESKGVVAVEPESSETESKVVEKTDTVESKSREAESKDGAEEPVSKETGVTESKSDKSESAEVESKTSPKTDLDTASKKSESSDIGATESESDKSESSDIVSVTDSKDAALKNVEAKEMGAAAVAVKNELSETESKQTKSKEVESKTSESCESKDELKPLVDMPPPRTPPTKHRFSFTGKAAAKIERYQSKRSQKTSKQDTKQDAKNVAKVPPSLPEISISDLDTGVTRMAPRSKDDIDGSLLAGVVLRRKPQARQEQLEKRSDQYLQQKIDHEIRMRDGTAKLLAASKHPQQMLEAAKNLLTSNSRMIAYMSELQRRKTHEVLQKNKAADGNQIPCQGKVAVSELRIPLMWKDSDHFRNKGDHRRYAVFCLWKIGTEIYDTTILKDVDRSMTDLSFEDVIVFNDIKPDFECQLEIYCHKLCEDLTMASTHRRIKKKFNEISTHVGRSVGKRLSGVKDESDFMSNMLVGPKFEVIANATLKLADITNSTATYDLGTDPAQVATEGGAAELPLFGHFCCRVAAQPHCMVKETASGFLRVKNGKSWERNWCQLKGMTLSCYDTPTGPDSNKKPCLKMKIQKNTQVLRGSPGSSSGQDFCFQLSSSSKFSKTQIFAADSDAELEKWWQALQQNLLDLALWQHACDENVEMPEIPSHRQSSYISRSSQRGSLYDETQLKDDVPDSPMSRILARLNVSEEDDELESKLSGNGSKKGEMKVETDV